MCGVLKWKAKNDLFNNLVSLLAKAEKRISKFDVSIAYGKGDNGKLTSDLFKIYHRTDFREVQ